MGFLGSAICLGVYAGWSLTAEIVRPPRPSFPAERTSTQASAATQTQAAIAASIGIIRGDLWADDAIILGAGLENDTLNPGPLTIPTALAARAAAEKAAALEPCDSRMWLLIALTYAQTELRNPRIEATLIMSYLSAPNSTALMPLRLLLAVRSEGIANPDLQILVSGEIRAIVRGRPGLRSAIVAAYRNANPVGREFVTNTLRDLDPELLAVARRG
jgi:hypothetical protein